MPESLTSKEKTAQQVIDEIPILTLLRSPGRVFYSCSIDDGRLFDRAAAEIDRLQAELAKLKADHDQFVEWANPQIVTHGKDVMTIEALEARVRELEADARRYRWVRENGPYNWAPWSTAEKMDAAIDAALAKEGT